MNRVWKAKSLDYLAKVEVLDQLGKSYKVGKRILDDVGLGAEEANKFWQEGVELNLFKRMFQEGGLKLTQAGEAVIRNDLVKYQDKLASAGLSPQQIKSLNNEAMSVGKRYDGAIRLAEESGVDLADNPIGTYLSKILSKDVNFALEKYAKTNFRGESGSKAFMDAFTKSHLTNEFLVEDEVLLAYMTGKKVEDIVDLVGDDKRLTDVLINQLTPQQLTAIVDSGVLSKIPMTSTRAYEKIVQKFNMPYKGISEFMITDPKKAYRIFAEKLTTDIANSSTLKNIFKEGISQGWVVSQAMKNSDPQYSKFVQLPPSLVDEFGVPGAELGGYMHPRVVEMVESVIGVGRSPAKMGEIGKIFDYLQKAGKTLMLSTAEFVSRNTISNVFQYITGNGNLFHVVPSMIDMGRVMRGGKNALDNSRKVYGSGKYTARELYELLEARGVISPMSGLVGTRLGEGADSFNSINPLNIPRALGYLGHSFKTYGFVPGVEYSARLFHDAAQAAAFPIMFASSFTENAFKFAMFKSVMGDQILNRVGQFATQAKARHIPNIDEATRYVEDYFFAYDDVGTIDKTISQSVLPFWTYLSRNVPAQFRNAMRNPGLFLGYQRAYAAMNEPAYEAGADLPEGGIDEYTLKSKPIFWKDEGGEWFALGLSNFDPIADATQWAQDTVQDIGRATGLYVGTEREKRDMLTKSGGVGTTLNRIMDSTYPAWKQALFAWQASRGEGQVGLQKTRDRDGDVPTSFLGVRMSPSVRFFLENTVPSLGYINRVNPGNVFGVREQRDYKTGEVKRAGQRSIFGAERSDRDAVDARSRAIKTVTGVTPRPIDVFQQMGYTEGDMGKVASEVKGTLNRLETQIKSMPPGPERDKQYNLYQETKLAYDDLKHDMNEVKRWRVERGLPAPKAAKERARLNKIQSNLGNLTPEDQAEFAKEYDKNERSVVRESNKVQGLPPPPTAKQEEKKAAFEAAAKQPKLREGQGYAR